MREDVILENKQIEPQPALALIVKLCQTLAAEGIDYCHWKSNEALARSASGDNDLDLLVSRADAERFTRILFELGFRQAQDHPANRLPGVLNFYGYDAPSDRLIHVHAHYQLILGNDLSKNYRIPLERAYQESSRQVGLFRVPAPEFELVIFVIRMVLKHSTWDSILMGQGRLSRSESRELKDLATEATLARVDTVLQHLPYVDRALFKSCLDALQPGCSLLARARAGERLQTALEACARRPHASDILSKVRQYAWLLLHVGLLRQNIQRRLANGGLMIALVGGDGSGKTTAIEGTARWLSRKFDVLQVHMGKPAWSWSTRVIWGVLKVARLLGVHSRGEQDYGDERAFPGYPWLIRRVCVARDRYLTYLRARRFSSNGGLVIIDRFSLPFLAMDAPQCARVAQAFKKSNWLLRWLSELEQRYYSRIAMPDLLIVLRVDPEVAVKRKPEESAASVRARSTLVWELDWSTTPAHVVDASLSKDEVLAQIKSLVWEHL